MNHSKDFDLLIDGPLFRRQRELLIAVADSARNRRDAHLGADEASLLEGLVELTDAIADQAHDRGIDCLIAEPHTKAPL
ncbi:MAG TPA: hypothetical protein VHC22_02080 [Pirellulales bacterium]|nr:hypothetical protein [Pirellulales bacterium]